MLTKWKVLGVFFYSENKRPFLQRGMGWCSCNCSSLLKLPLLVEEFDSFFNFFSYNDKRLLIQLKTLFPIFHYGKLGFNLGFFVKASICYTKYQWSDFAIKKNRHTRQGSTWLRLSAWTSALFLLVLLLGATTASCYSTCLRIKSTLLVAGTTNSLSCQASGRTKERLVWCLQMSS